MPRRLLAYLVARSAPPWRSLAPAFGAEAGFSARPAHRAGAARRSQAEHAIFRLRRHRPQGRRSPFSTCRPAPMPNSSARRTPRTSTASTDLKRENFSFHGGIGLLVTGRARSNGVTLHKWFLLATAPADTGPHRADQGGSAGDRARGLFRRGRAQGAGERHVPPAADSRAAWLAAVQARTSSPASG